MKIVIASMFLTVVLLCAQDSLRLPPSLQPPFDVNEVIEEVCKNQWAPEAGQFLIDTNVVYVSGRYAQENPSVAFDGTNYLVVWHDSRYRTYFRGYDIYGTRVDQNGVVLDPEGIEICKAVNDQSAPSAAFDGTNYLVVWHDYRNGVNYSADIYGKRLSRQGVVLDSGDIAITTAGYNQYTPKAAFDGTNFFVVWTDRRSGASFDIYGTRVNRLGVVLDPDGIAVDASPYPQYISSVAVSDAGYLVVWTELRPVSSSDIFGKRVSPEGMIIDSTAISICEEMQSQCAGSVGYDGTNFFVVWEDQRGGSPYNGDVYAARITQSGLVLDSGGFAISKQATNQISPVVSFDGRNYLVVWVDRQNIDDIYGARVHPSGVVIDSLPFVISSATSAQWCPAVCFGNGNCLVAWADQRENSNFYDIYGARVGPSGTTLDPDGLPLSLQAYWQLVPAASFGGSNYLVVWQDNRHGFYSDIYGARISLSGRVLDPIGFPICTAPSDQRNPAVGFDGKDYFVVWEDDRDGYDSDVYGLRVDRSGAIVDTQEIVVSRAVDAQKNPALAFDGMNYFVVWEDDRSLDIFGARVTTSGLVLDTAGIRISAAANHQYTPSIAFDGSNYMVVWRDDRTSGYSDIYGARVDRTGTVLDNEGIRICARADLQCYPAVDFGVEDYLVVWQDHRDRLADIYGSRISQAGVVLDTQGLHISCGPDNECTPSIAFGGKDYCVTWHDYCYGAESNAYGVKVNTSGNIIDSFAVSLQEGDQNWTAVAQGISDRFLIVYSGWTDQIKCHPANTMRIWGMFFPKTAVAVADDALSHEGLRLAVSPNPFRRQVRIELGTGHRAKSIELKIFDVSGRVVRQFNRLTIQPFNEVTWDGTDDRGKPLPAGVYFCVLKSENDLVSRKVVRVE